MRFLPLFLAAALALPAADVQIVEEIIAKINGEIVTRSEMDRRIAELRADLMRQNLAGAPLEQAMTERQKDILRDLIDESLLVQRAKELNLNVESQVIKYLDDLRRQNNVATMEEFEKFVTERSGTPFEDLKEQVRNRMLTDRVMQQEVSHRISVSKEEVAKYYEEHKQEFVRPEQVRLRQILVSTEGKEPKEIPALEKKANDIVARLKKGERFPDLATKLSDDKESAAAGGDIGFWKRGLLDKQIEDMAFNARRGFVSDVIKRPNGFLILRVEERHQAGQASLEDVEQEIMERLYMPKFQPAMREYLTRLRDNAFIEIRAGLVDTSGVPGKDTTWRDPEQFKPAVTTKEEVTKKKRRLLWVVPRPGGKSKIEPRPSPEAKPSTEAKPSQETKAPPAETEKPKQP